MSTEAPTEAVLEEARRRLEHGAACAPAAADARELAWALKTLCYEAWNSEPSRAVRAAEALQELLAAGVPPGQADEVRALAAWTGAIAQLTRGQMAEALRGLDEARDAFQRAGLADPAAQTQVPRIMVLSMLGRHDEAAACAEAAQRELLALGNVRVASRVSLNLGGLRYHRDAYAAASRHYREAAVLFARTGDIEHSVLADIGQADALAALGDFDEALRIYARARMRAGRREQGMQLALVDESVALVELARGRYREALAGFESARRRYEALALPHYLAIAEKQLADAYLELRLLPEAQALFERAVDQFAALELPVEQAWALAQRGRTQAWLGQRGLAAESFAAAAALFETQGNAVGAAAVALARAELALAEGQGEPALAWAERAARGFAQAGQGDGQARAEVLHADALLHLGRVALAEAAYTQLLAAAREQQRWQVQLRCLSGQGQAAAAQGRADAAKAAFDAAIELFEDQRRALPGDEVRSAFLTGHLRPFHERLRLALADEPPQAVLLQLERCRARALGEQLADEQAVPVADGDDDGDGDGLRERLNWLYRRVQRLHDEGGRSTTLDDELRRTEHTLLERARRQRLTDATSGARSGELDLPALQAALQPGDALIEYGVLDDELFACVVTRGAVRVQRRLASWAQVLEASRSLRFQLDSLRHGAAPVQRHLDALTRRTQSRLVQLHGLVWAGLADAVAGCQRLLIVPHAQLGALPFAALHDGEQALGERHELALVPSARIALRGLRRPAAPVRRVLALGESTRLPHAAREADGVAAMFDGGRALLGPAATIDALRREAPGVDLLHLACHAQFRADNPRFSALHLHDGALTVERVEALALGPCTVVLSACESGLSDVGAGDEAVGLVRGFLVAGAARVLASLWPVDDAVTADFMARFHAALREGVPAAVALDRAQRQMRQVHGHAHFWAAFALYGSW